MKRLCAALVALILVFGFVGCTEAIESFEDEPAFSEPVYSEPVISEPEEVSSISTPEPESVPEEPETALFEVLRVIDGDTFVIDYGGTEERVRLLLIDTPESVHPDETRNVPYGKIASDFTKSVLEGESVSLEFDVQERDHYGRLLAYAYIGDVMLNELLLSEGHAVVSVYQPNVKYVDEFRALEAQAKEDKVGLWAEEMFSDAPEVEATPEPAPEETPAATGAYIANANTGKFHVAGCSSVNKMAEHNKVPYATRDECIAAGYVGCKRCNP